MTTNDLEWKRKYLSSLDKLEKMEQNWNEVEELLRLGITRVALAAQGVDDKLDQHLNSLRKAIRSGKNYAGLDTIVDNISDSVKRIDEHRKHETVIDNQPATILLRLMESISLPGANKRRARSLQKSLKKADSNVPLDDLLRELAEFINDSLNTENQGKSNTKKGLLNRLFDFETKPAPSNTSISETGDETHQPDNNPNDDTYPVAAVFAEFIDYLRQCGLNDAQLDRLQQSLGSASDNRTIRPYTEQLAQLIARLATQKDHPAPAGETTSAAISTEQTVTYQEIITLLLLIIDGVEGQRLNLATQRQQLSQSQGFHELPPIANAIATQITTTINTITTTTSDANTPGQTQVNLQQTNEQMLAFGINLLQQTLIALNLADTQPQRANALTVKISDAQQPLELEALCQEIAALTMRVLVHPASEAKANLSADEQPGICSFSLQLLDSLNFPVELQHQVTQLRDQLILGVAIIDTPKILNGIADLVSLTRSNVEQEKQDLQDFLQQLTENLHDIDKYIAGAQSQRAAAMVSNEEFGNTFDAHVKDIRSSLEDVSDPKQLKLIIRGRIDTIRDHVFHHRDGEMKHHQQLEEELTKTNTRLKELEMESQQLRQRLIEEHAHAIHDPLTGMLNRLAYEERITQEYSRWKRYQTPLSLLVFDIDHFKRINDTYGHKAGDKALKLIAKCLQSNIRESDFIARFGGEEFVAIMPETTIKDALEAANKLRQAVEKNQFHYEGKDVKITVSCGAAQFQKNDSIDSTFQRADKSLYICKQQGRNRCHTSDT